MSRFYLIGETMSPALVWGFLGTDKAFTQKCQKFKVRGNSPIYMHM